MIGRQLTELTLFRPELSLLSQQGPAASAQSPALTISVPWGLRERGLRAMVRFKAMNTLFSAFLLERMEQEPDLI